MSRSPWREALDGQVTILRELRRDSTIIHYARAADTPSLKQYCPRESDRVRILSEAGVMMASEVSNLIREAEPVYLSHDIQDNVEHHYRPDEHTTDTIVLTPEILPIQHGFIWLGTRGMHLADINEPGTGRPFTVVVRAVYFGDDVEAILRPGRIPSLDLEIIRIGQPTSRGIRGMSVTVFLDSTQSGYVNMSQQLGHHIVPVALGIWEFGASLSDYVRSPKDQPDSVDQKGTGVLIGFIGNFLYHLFRMMQQRITRWGGVGLNRTEAREAEREKLRPRVQLVTWRKANYVYPEGYLPVAKNWSCRWSVRPHIRRYKSGKVVQIKSYIKGPPDKEFRLPLERAHQVVR